MESYNTILDGFGKCIITLDNKEFHCSKCTTPNRRNGKWYCPKHRVYLEIEAKLYQNIFRNIKED